MSDHLSDAAENPKRGTVDGNTVEQHSLREQIEYDRYKNSKTARSVSSSPFAGLRMGKMSHPPTA